ncbi:MAG: hypothetical protein KA731_03040 [Candidatus Moranbacteria bacterium]|nr:hypothetical protein [Candidatus Moranbacteria bacterium]MBP6034340.1 hypothetical protein [Candidatus Moranbacteria bacterium]MBP7695795.1 hypothetical protein [Candidatus Moranbacteria bacterium]
MDTVCPETFFRQLAVLTDKLLALSDEQIAAAEPGQLLDEEYDVCLGKADPALRRLYTLLSITRSSQSYLPFDFFIADYPEEKQHEICREICLSVVEIETLNWLFRSEVVWAFPDFRSAGLLEKIGMRKGWIVAVPKPEPFPRRKVERVRILED